MKNKLSNFKINKLIKSRNNLAIYFYSENIPQSIVDKKIFLEFIEQNQIGYLILDVDKYKKIATKFNVNIVPYVIIFRRGKIANIDIGIQTIESLNSYLK